jgi:phosphomannomutase
VLHERLQGAVNFTASHNPPEYNGVKFSSSDGAPALPEITQAIEALIDRNDVPPGDGAAPPETPARPREPYLERIREIVKLDEIRRADLSVVVDPLWGTARGYIDALLRDAGVKFEMVHDSRDVLFGGHAPEPETSTTRELAARMAATGAQLGLATDGDADRFGVLDRDGNMVSPNHIIALLFDYLVESRGWRNGVGKSVATTNLLNALAEYHKVPLHETPVGFKYLGQLIQRDEAAIVGEESAGLSIRHHVPEKDGIIACLLVAEMVAVRRASLGEQLQQLFKKVGPYYPVRENFRLTPETQARLDEKLRSEPANIGPRKVRQYVRTDGLKMVLDDGSWVLFRPSGTEPVVRLYAETRDKDELPHLVEAARKYLLAS